MLPKLHISHFSKLCHFGQPNLLVFDENFVTDLHVRIFLRNAY